MFRVTATTIFLLLLITIKINAQDKFTQYENSYTGKTYEIQMVSKSIDNFTLYIDAMSLDELHDKGGIMIKERQHQDFLNSLNEAKLKYEEWVKTAKENNVTDLRKTMNIKSKVGAYFFYGDWNFQFAVYLTFDFKILEVEGDLKYVLIVGTGKLKSSSNEFMTVDGFVLVFSSSNEIDSFANEISTQKIKDFISKPKEKDLFKN